MKIKTEHWQCLLRYEPALYKAGRLIEPANWMGYLLTGGDPKTVAEWQARAENNQLD